MKISKQELAGLGACASFLERFIRETNNTDGQVDIASLIVSNNGVSDWLWLAGKILPKERIVQFAVNCAKMMGRFSYDQRFATAIEAAENWISNPTEENRLKAREAATLASAAYSAAYAAAAYTTYSADVAADAAASAADHKEIRERIGNELRKLFEEE